MSSFKSDNEVWKIIDDETKRQEETVELIASENFCSEEIRAAVGSILCNKYTEGYPGNRYYGGCENYDRLENLCRERWLRVFHAENEYHCNVQPHSGSQANLAAFAAVLKPGDTILSMSLDNGGHLTHGSKVNQSGKLYNIVSYGVDDSGFIDYEEIERLIKEHHPKLVLAGASAYSRVIMFSEIKKIIDRVSTDVVAPIFMVDMAHIAGLVATGYHPTPFGYADIVTTTTHKTLRSTRGGLIFCKKELAKKIDSAVFPGTQGGSLMHSIAGKCIGAFECMQPEFAEYIGNVVKNCKAMADEFVTMGYKVITGGTDNHLFLLDLTGTGITGRELQDACDAHNITLNKNCIPNEPLSPKETSGVRIGTAPMTTRGYTTEDFIEVAHRIDEIIKNLAQQKED